MPDAIPDKEEMSVLVGKYPYDVWNTVLDLRHHV